MNRRVLPLIIGSLLLPLGCGGDDDPTAPVSPTVLSITVTGPPEIVDVGTSEFFFATASFSDGTSRNVSADALWTSSDPSVVTVSATGSGMAIAAGEAEICATYEGVRDCLRVTVTVTVPDTIALTSITPPASDTLRLAQQVSFAATVGYALNSAETGEIQMFIQDQTGAIIQPGPRPSVAISRGSGMVTLSDTITISAAGVTRVDVFLALFPAGQSFTNAVVVVSYLVQQPPSPVSKQPDNVRWIVSNVGCVPREVHPRGRTPTMLTSCTRAPEGTILVGR